MMFIVFLEFSPELKSEADLSRRMSRGQRRPHAALVVHSRRELTIKIFVAANPNPNPNVILKSLGNRAVITRHPH